MIIFRHPPAAVLPNTLLKYFDGLLQRLPDRTSGYLLSDHIDLTTRTHWAGTVFKRSMVQIREQKLGETDLVKRLKCSRYSGGLTKVACVTASVSTKKPNKTVWLIAFDHFNNRERADGFGWDN